MKRKLKNGERGGNENDSHCIYFIVSHGLLGRGSPRRPDAELDANEFRKTFAPSGAPIILPLECKYNGVRLTGRVQIVEHGADFRVQKVEQHPDLEVAIKNDSPINCGDWELVQSNPDFKVQLVTASPDFRIKIVDEYGGVPATTVRINYR